MLTCPAPHDSFFKTLVDHEVTVELKNDISIRGTLKSVDQFLNIKLDDISVVEELKYPHLVCRASSPNPLAPRILGYPAIQSIQMRRREGGLFEGSTLH